MVHRYLPTKSIFQLLLLLKPLTYRELVFNRLSPLLRDIFPFRRIWKIYLNWTHIKKCYNGSRTAKTRENEEEKPAYFTCLPFTDCGRCTDFVILRIFLYPTFIRGGDMKDRFSHPRWRHIEIWRYKIEKQTIRSLYLFPFRASFTPNLTLSSPKHSFLPFIMPKPVRKAFFPSSDSLLSVCNLIGLTVRP